MCLTRFACRFTSSLFLGERFVFIKKKTSERDPQKSRLTSKPKYTVEPI